jgi:hypothetical protein
MRGRRVVWFGAHAAADKPRPLGDRPHMMAVQCAACVRACQPRRCATPPGWGYGRRRGGHTTGSRRGQRHAGVQLQVSLHCLLMRSNAQQVVVRCSAAGAKDLWCQPGLLPAAPFRRRRRCCRQPHLSDDWFSYSPMASAHDDSSSLRPHGRGPGCTAGSCSWIMAARPTAAQRCT